MESYLSARTVNVTDLKSSEEEDHSKIVGAIASTNEMMDQLLTRTGGKSYGSFTTPAEF